MQNCRRKAPDNNNSVKFTSSRGDNSTTNDSMVMKIAHAQLDMYTNIMYKFQSSTCKTVREELRTKLCPRTDRQTDRQTDGRTDRQPWRFQYTPLHFVVGSIKIQICTEGMSYNTLYIHVHITGQLSVYFINNFHGLQKQ